MEDDRIEDNISQQDYLKDLADRLRAIPASYNVDEFDTDKLHQVASSITEMAEALKAMLVAFDAPHIATKDLADTSAIKKARVALARLK